MYRPFQPQKMTIYPSLTILNRTVDVRTIQTSDVVRSIVQPYLATLWKGGFNTLQVMTIYTLTTHFFFRYIFLPFPSKLTNSFNLLPRQKDFPFCLVINSYFNNYRFTFILNSPPIIVKPITTRF